MPKRTNVTPFQQRYPGQTPPKTDPALEGPTTTSGPTVVLPKDTRPPLTVDQLRSRCHAVATALRAMLVTERQSILNAPCTTLAECDALVEAIEGIGRYEAAAKAVLSWSGHFA